MSYHMYKGYSIVRQFVGPRGWNVVDVDQRCIKVGLSSLQGARAWIDHKLDTEQALLEVKDGEQ